MALNDDKNQRKPLGGFDEWRASREKPITTEPEVPNERPEQEKTRVTTGSFFSRIGSWLRASATSVWAWISHVARLVVESTVAAARSTWAYLASLWNRSRERDATRKTQLPQPLSLWVRFTLFFSIIWFAIKDMSGTFWATLSTGGYTQGKKVATGFVAALLVVFLTVGLVRFEYVTATSGISNSLGSGANQTVLIDKGAHIERNALVVAKLPKAANATSDQYVMGVVFSFNDQTYAIYDGKVIWQIPVANIKGEVLFAEPSKKF